MMPRLREDKLRSYIKSSLQNWMRTGIIFLVFLAGYGYYHLYSNDDDDNDSDNEDMEDEAPTRGQLTAPPAYKAPTRERPMSDD
jgi:hypothetical protein